MNTTNEEPTIHVGVDGSVASVCAVRWVAQEARRRNVPLRLIHSVDYTGIAFGYNLGFSQSFFDAMENDAKAFLAEAEREARAVYPSVEIHVKQLTGPPASALIEARSGRDDIRECPIPAKEIADDLGLPQAANVVMVGALAEATGVVSLDTLERVLEERLGERHRATLDTNRKALRRGAELAAPVVV